MPCRMVMRKTHSVICCWDLLGLCDCVWVKNPFMLISHEMTYNNQNLPKISENNL